MTYHWLKFELMVGLIRVNGFKIEGVKLANNGRIWQS